MYLHSKTELGNDQHKIPIIALHCILWAFKASSVTTLKPDNVNCTIKINPVPITHAVYPGIRSGFGTGCPGT